MLSTASDRLPLDDIPNLTLFNLVLCHGLLQSVLVSRNENPFEALLACCSATALPHLAPYAPRVNKLAVVAAANAANA